MGNPLESDIKAADLNSEKIAHSRSFEELVKSSTDPQTGHVDLQVLQSYEGSCGSNGGVGCDVTVGPCSCGAWH